MSSVKWRKIRIEVASGLVLAVTVVLFAVALFEKGFTHDILLEAGVFLVSAKLILASQKSNLDSQILEEKLNRILRAVEKKEPTVYDPRSVSRTGPTQEYSL